MAKRKRRFYSKKNELIKKSQESAMAAIQAFNNPLITFKSETFIVLMVIAWTYLLHAYYRQENIEYRYFDQKNNRKQYKKTTHGAYKHWSLETCLSYFKCPLDPAIKDNLIFLIGIRHEIEHQMTTKIDEMLSSKFQACCINYNKTIKNLFGNEYGLDQTLPVSLQLFSLGEEVIDQLVEAENLPKNIIEFVSDFEGNLSSIDDPRYSYKVIYLRDNVNHENQANIAYRFVSEDSDEGKEIHNILIKNNKYKKLTEAQVIEEIKKAGYKKFTKTAHQNFWKQSWKDAETRNHNEEAKRYGEVVINKMWMWYKETWIPKVKEFCKNTGSFT